MTQRNVIMAANQTINFKEPSLIATWLDTALSKEKEKYEKCPVMRDLVLGHQNAQGWGYALAGYFLLEQSFKALLYVRGKNVPKTHSLSVLFDLFEQDDKTVIREFYADYRATIGGRRSAFPFRSPDDFLANLDGDGNGRGDRVGSFDWRYFLIEEKRSRKMPLFSLDYLHEIVFGCIQIIRSADGSRFDPSLLTRSWRMRRERQNKYRDWLVVRMNSDGWDELGDRLEILWGPDYRGRYDLCFFKGERQGECFSEISDDFPLPVFDKRKEIEAFDAEEGYRSIGMTKT